MKIQEFLEHINDKLPPVPIERVIEFEQLIGAFLPDDYRQFLIECNGGHVGGSLWYFGPTPEGKDADAGVHHIGGLRGESSFSLISAKDCYQSTELRIPRDLIWIMDDPFGNAICLGIKGSLRGKVYFWDHEQEPDPDTWDGKVETAENLELLANSFTDFVSGLCPTPDE